MHGGSQLGRTATGQAALSSHMSASPIQMVESTRTANTEPARQAAAGRTHRRQRARRRAVALLLAAATLAAVTVLSRNPPGPPTLLAAVGSGPSHLDSGAPRMLPGNILVADRGNNRLAVISPRGQLAWSQHIKAPTNAFVAPTNGSVIVTQRTLSVVLRYGINNGILDYHYGRPDWPGAGDDRLRQPDGAQQLVDGELVVADEANCRILLLAPPVARPAKVFGRSGVCMHDPPASFSYPDSAFPTSGGRLVVTERNPGWVDVLGRGGRLIQAVRVRGLSAPMDANEFAPGRIVITAHSHPGVVEELTSDGTVLWRFAPTHGPGELSFPSFAQVLADGDVLVSDSGNDRIIVIDPRTAAIVWQYGHTGQPGSGAGYLDAPDGAVLLNGSR
jgi:hypothetical protein